MNPWSEQINKRIPELIRKGCTDPEELYWKICKEFRLSKKYRESLQNLIGTLRSLMLKEWKKPSSSRRWSGTGGTNER